MCSELAGDLCSAAPSLVCAQRGKLAFPTFPASTGASSQEPEKWAALWASVGPPEVGETGQGRACAAALLE